MCWFVKIAAAALSLGVSIQLAHADERFCTASSNRDLSAAANDGAIFDPDACDPYSLAVQAFVWGKPIVDAAKIRVFFTRPEDPFAQRLPSVAGAALNRFGHGRILADPDNKSGVGPNNDTLYSNATFDVQSGPFVIQFPDFGDRYYTFSIAHPDSSTSSSIGQRTHGSQLPPVFLHADDYAGRIPAGMLPISAKDRYIHFWGRTLVRSPDELPSIVALQNAIVVQRYAAGQLLPVGVPPQQTDWPMDETPVAFLKQLRTAIEAMSLTPQDAAIAAIIAPLLSDVGYDSGAEAEILRGLADGELIVDRASREFGIAHGGWSVNLAGGRFGSDWLLRSAVAKDQIFVTIPEEAIYPLARRDAAGDALDGRSDYRIRFDAPPPVDGFWSITLYDDSGAMVANSIDRYSIGNRTPGVSFVDGEPVDVIISGDKPEDENAVWLPSPPGQFYLMMRLYRPRPQIRQGTWLPPEIVKLERRAGNRGT